MTIGYVSISDARDVGLHSGTSKFIIEGLEREGASIVPIYPLDRSFRFAFSAHKAFAKFSGSSFVVDRQPLALNSYAAQVERILAHTKVDLLFSNSSVPLTRVRSATPMLFWTDAVWHDMYNYYRGQFSNPTPGTHRHALRQEEDGLRNVDAAVYTSQWAARTAQRLSPSTQIEVITRGANLPISHGDAAVQRWALDRVKRRKCNLLFIGSDWQRKGGPVALEVAGLLNSMHIPTELAVIGCVPRGDISDFVKHVGFIDKNTQNGYDVFRSHLQQANFLILPTNAEAGGIAFCEASAFGVPSLAYNTGGVAEYVREGVNGFTFPLGTSAHVIAHEISKLREDDERYLALAANSFAEYKTRLNWRSSIQKLLSLMELVCRVRSAGARGSGTGSR